MQGVSRGTFDCRRRAAQSEFRADLEVTGSLACSPDRLKPFTSYKFRMLATNDIGDSVISKETEAVTTLQDGERLAVCAQTCARIKGIESNRKPLLIPHLGDFCSHRNDN